ncbi:ABC transporter ATP-binding protein [Actinomadura rubrisoli]|uniref:ABC transporter ATP-binding protein n=1 Tax=Actinomadura rubrisoli TaxID=2530368 RepID=UPI001404BF3E|nr:ATP-binding cassette domain-containing protein [Actinomadura rubrisoli]
MIEARGLARTFTGKHGAVEAVRGVDLSVASGEIVGFLGPNGAGKSTTLRMLTTLLAPTAGTASVAGRDLRADPAGVRRRIGYVAQGGGTDPSVPLGEELDLQARLYGVPDRAGRVAELCARLDLAGLEARPAGSLSGGQRRRLDIALGLVHRPPLLFLDEPTTGLDPQSRGNLWDHIRSMRDRDGTTVFLTTHYLDEADALCDRLLIIDQGRIVAEGTPEQLKRRIAGDVVTLELADIPTPAHTAIAANASGAAGAAKAAGRAPAADAVGVAGTAGVAGSVDAAGTASAADVAGVVGAADAASAAAPANAAAAARVARVAERARAALSGHPAVREAAVSGRIVRLTVENGERELMGLVRALDAAGVELASLSLARPTLDDVFLTVTGRSLREAA